MSYPGGESPAQTIRQIKTTALDPHVRSMLTAYECTIVDEKGKGYTVILPEGTTRTELFPRTIEARFRIRLPGGLELRQIDNRQERSSLFIIINEGY